MLNFIFTKHAMKLKINIGQIIERKSELAFCHHPTQLMLESDTKFTFGWDLETKEGQVENNVKITVLQEFNLEPVLFSFFIKQVWYMM